jgi:hypothetical protein
MQRAEWSDIHLRMMGAARFGWLFVPHQCGEGNVSDMPLRVAGVVISGVRRHYVFD